MSGLGSRSTWGPLFWKVLHTCSECVGYQTDHILSSDEAEAWIALLKAQQGVMPCAVCRQHYGEWLRTHRVERLRDIHGFVRYEWLQKQLWDLHESVNKRADPPTNGKVTLKDLPALYPRSNLHKELYELGRMFTWGLEAQQLKSEEIHRWKAAIARLRVMYGL